MKNTKQEHMNYSSISKNELFILSLLKTNEFIVFGTKEVQHLSGWNKTRVHNTLFSLVKKNILTRIKRNTYTLTENINENIFNIATEMIIPSYIGFWTALSYYGFTEQQIRTIQLVSTKQIKNIEFKTHKIQTITFQPREFFGYKRIDGFVIAEKEKALIDSLFQLRRCGGLNEYAKCLKNAWNEINKKQLLHYLIMFQNKSLISRMGYLIEQLNLNNTSLLNSLEEKKSISSIKLNPYKEKTSNYDGKWNVLINDVIHEEEIK